MEIYCIFKMLRKIPAVRLIIYETFCHCHCHVMQNLLISHHVQCRIVGIASTSMFQCSNFNECVWVLVHFFFAGVLNFLLLVDHNAAKFVIFFFPSLEKIIHTKITSARAILRFSSKIHSAYRVVAIYSKIILGFYTLSTVCSPTWCFFFADIMNQYKW